MTSGEGKGIKTESDEKYIPITSKVAEVAEFIFDIKFYSNMKTVEGQWRGYCHIIQYGYQMYGIQDR